MEEILKAAYIKWRKNRRSIMEDFDAGFDRGQEHTFETLIGIVYGKEALNTTIAWIEEAGE